MPGFANVTAFAAAYDEGRTSFCSFRKVPSQASVTNWWVDLSMAAGNPLPNYYASSPLVAATLDPYRGIYHGASQAPASKHLAEFGVMTPSGTLLGQFCLLDYLLYYPFVDMDTLDAQLMDNTVVLPRYEDGDGVRVMAVAVAPTVGGGQFTFDYENQDGVVKTSPIQYCATTAASIASLVCGQPAVANSVAAPFLTLANGDRGVRRIIGVNMLVPNGGLMALVLVKPLMNCAIREANTMSEVSFVRERAYAPRILDGAYLNLITCPSGSVGNNAFAGYAKFVWSKN